MEVLRIIRINENLNQKRMASEMKVSYSAYKKVESGVRKPSAGFIRKFKTRFPDNNVDFFFTESR